MLAPLFDKASCMKGWLYGSRSTRVQRPTYDVYYGSHTVCTVVAIHSAFRQKGVACMACALFYFIVFVVAHKCLSLRGVTVLS